MKKKPAIRRHHAPQFYVIFAVGTFFVGVFVTLVFTKVLAQTNETIYACVNKVGGNMRVVKADETCSKNENSLSWNKEGPAGPQGPSGGDSGLPYSCANCYLGAHADKFAGKNLTGAQLNNATFGAVDLSNVIFQKGFFRNVDFRGANLTGADFSNLLKDAPNFYESSQNIRFNDANLTNANFSNSKIGSSEFNGANMQNTNFSNAILKYLNFSGAQNMNTANITDTTWEGVTCPDGTNSNNNGNTCAGHF